jgi:hypothetical protein
LSLSWDLFRGSAAVHPGSSLPFTGSKFTSEDGREVRQKRAAGETQV